MLRNTMKALKNAATNRVEFMARNVRDIRWFNDGIEIAMYYTDEKHVNFIDNVWKGLSRSRRLTPRVQKFIRDCYKRGMVEFRNEQSKLHFCGVWDAEELDK